jgi:hypothetical protein
LAVLTTIHQVAESVFTSKGSTISVASRRNNK